MYLTLKHIHGYYALLLQNNVNSFIKILEFTIRWFFKLFFMIFRKQKRKLKKKKGLIH